MKKNTAVKRAKDKKEKIEQVEDTNIKRERAQDEVSDKSDPNAEQAPENAENGNESRGKEAETLDDVANPNDYKAENLSQRTIDKAYELGQRAADTFEKSSEYVRNLDPARIRNKAISSVKRKPEVTVTVAALAGIIVGYLVGRRSN
ncbi:MAG: hypothetical protein HKN25_10375 [Pyrinomonadaceae bacterium]|nr:hypothetical protein [Pyrinomonadaceae bacterium]